MTNSSIILVGNSQDATKKELGQEIEAFDIVVRFNNYVSAGYEKYVGHKTNIWFSRICSTIVYRDPSQFDEVVGSANWCRYSDAILAITAYWERTYGGTVVGMVSCKRYSEEFGYNHMNEWLSVGMIAIMYYLEQYPQVHITGFGGEGHYYPKAPVDACFHNWEKESAYIKDHEKTGQIVRI